MHDLTGAYSRLERLYRLYIKSAFPMRSPALSTERDSMLQERGVLSQPPLLETVPLYRSSGYDLASATAQLPAAYAGLSALGQKLFSPEMSLYQHQWESLSEAILNNKDVVVTTGTGSGKTECFLLPLLAQIARESASWQAAGNLPPNRDWWNPSSGSGKVRTPQWGHIARPKAVRAMILYPLNALVEDQLRRLRGALDNDDVHSWLDSERGGNRITFGRYTGLTPIPGSETDRNRERLRKHLKEAAEQRADVIEALRANPERNSDVQYYFPRLDGGEMWSRWDMQATPPDILITNYSMLNIMMMRTIEDNIFTTTRDWLAEEGHPERVFCLIVDELHAYRGTPGTEVAYILRLLLYRLGLQPDSPKLRIVTTTASLDDDEKGRKFLREFFGRDQFAFISGQQVDPVPGSWKALAPHGEALAEFARRVQPEVAAGSPDPTSDCVRQEAKALAEYLGESENRDCTEVEQLGEALFNVGAPDALRDACREVNGSVRPTQIPHLDEKLFPGSAHDGELASDAMRGLLLALGMSRRKSTGRSPQQVRGHLFFHNLQNLWVCCNPNCTDPLVNRVARQAEAPTHRPAVGGIHTSHRMTCSCGSRVLDLIVCEVCGDVFLGGYRAQVTVGQQVCTFLTADEPDLKSMPDQASSSQLFSEYALFWPLSQDEPWQVAPQDLEWTHDYAKRKWVKAKLKYATGQLLQESTPPREGEIPGWLYLIPTPSEKASSMPTKCPRCDADHHARKVFKSPLRNHRTGFQKACQVLASALFREMDGDGVNARKLVIFTDSRQDAAKLAAGMERDHFHDMVRVVLVQAFREYWSQLVAYLRRMHSTSAPALRGALQAFMLEQLREINPLLYDEVGKAEEATDPALARKFDAANKQVMTESQKWANGSESDNQQARADWLNLLRVYPGPVPLASLRGTIRDKLLEVGMCPGEPTGKGKMYRPRPDGMRTEPWYNCFDWSNYLPVPKIDATPAQLTHITMMENLLTSRMMYAIFSHVARTLEGIGQGWVSYQPAGNPSERLVTVTEGVIRQLGVRGIYQFSSTIREGSEEKFRPISRAFINNQGLAENDVRKQLLESGAGTTTSTGIGLVPHKL